MEKLRTILIDDESDAIDSLIIIINDFCSKDIEIIGTANSVLEGIKEINTKKPDIVFLDVEMPGGSGFEMLESIENINFEVVFITAYNHYAIKAFKYNAIDYLMKPVDIDEFGAVVKKIKERKEKDQEKANLNKFIKEFQTNGISKRIQISTGKNIEFIEVNKLIRIEADGSYSKILIENSNDLYVSKKIVEIEKLLPNEGFFRPHKSHIINIKHVLKYSSNDNAIVMSNNTTVPLSKKRKDRFFELMGKN